MMRQKEDRGTAQWDEHETSRTSVEPAFVRLHGALHQKTPQTRPGVLSGPTKDGGERLKSARDRRIERGKGQRTVVRPGVHSFVPRGRHGHRLHREMEGTDQE